MNINLEKSQYHRLSWGFGYDANKVEFCRQLSQSFGWKEFNFDKILKKWVFSKSLLVQVIRNRFPGVDVSPEVEMLVETENAWSLEQKKKDDALEAIKKQETTSFHIKGLKKDLYMYQKVVVEFVDACGGRAILAMDMGTGKTAITLAYLKHKGFSRTLVVCPASVKFAWEDEVKKWTNMKSIIIDSKTDIGKIDPSVQVWIINYDLLKKHHDALVKIRWDACALDECQKCKSGKSLRTRAAKSITRDIPHLLLLSGTPLLSRPSELFTLLQMVDSKTWNNFYEFARAYCNMKMGRWGMDVSGASNTEELHARIKKYFIRKRKDEVLKELPPKIYIELPVELDKEHQEQYDVAARDLANYLRKFTGKTNPEIQRMLSAEKLMRLNILRQVNAAGKVDAAIELIESITDAGQKCLVFSTFNAPLEKLQQLLGKQAVMITGKTPMPDRKIAVDSFQNDPNVKVFLGGTLASGVGITLTAATSCIFIDRSFVPADHSQAESRLHRIGQKASSVNIYYLDVKDSIDEDMAELLEKKQEVFDSVIEGKFVKKSKDAMEKAVQRVLKNY